jgi:hypothetical protein
MRSRYSAFAVGEAAYLLTTWHPTTRPGGASSGARGGSGSRCRRRRAAACSRPRAPSASAPTPTRGCSRSAARFVRDAGPLVLPRRDLGSAHGRPHLRRRALGVLGAAGGRRHRAGRGRPRPRQPRPRPEVVAGTVREVEAYGNLPRQKGEWWAAAGRPRRTPAHRGPGARRLLARQPVLRPVAGGRRGGRPGGRGFLVWNIDYRPSTDPLARRRWMPPRPTTTCSRGASPTGSTRRGCRSWGTPPAGTGAVAGLPRQPSAGAPGRGRRGRSRRRGGAGAGGRTGGRGPPRLGAGAVQALLGGARRTRCRSATPSPTRRPAPHRGPRQVRARARRRPGADQPEP